MISLTDFQNTYNKFYMSMKKYFWDWETVEILAELEIAIHDAFRDPERSKILFSKLDKIIRPVYLEDEEFSDNTESLRKLIFDEDGTYLRLYQVTEALKDEN